jgi:DNA (cytosine-5)-methyltransferase 1
VRTFDGTRWRGIVELVSGGFPCQDISPAGKGKGLAGSKSSLWFEMLRIVCEIRPKYVFVENSAMLISRGLHTVLGGLSEARYDAEWLVMGANDVGANHCRKRLWLLAADTDSFRESQPKGIEQKQRGRDSNVRQKISNAESNGRKKQRQCVKSEAASADACDGGCKISNTRNNGIIERKRKLHQNKQTTSNGTSDRGGAEINAVGQWWQTEPRICRVVDGMDNRTNRLKAIGNGQVPLCAAVAFRVLWRRINEMTEK